MVGLLGAGQQGLRLLAAVNPAFITVKAIADLRPSNRSRARGPAAGLQGQGLEDRRRRDKDIRVYDSYDKLLAAAKADGLEAVIIALPSHLHAAAALAALDAGLHVFVETPMALSVADAKKVAQGRGEEPHPGRGPAAALQLDLRSRPGNGPPQPPGRRALHSFAVARLEAGKEARRSRAAKKDDEKKAKKPQEARRVQDRLVAGRARGRGRL